MRRRILMSRKRLMMSMIMVFAIAIATIVSFAVVFAASFQDVSTKLKVKYIIDGVGVKISANYVTVTDGTASSKTAIMTTDGASELEINVEDEVDLSNVGLEEVNVTLNSSTTKVIYEYKFTNTAQSAFTLSLGTDNLSSENMNLRYKVSNKEIAATELAGDFNDATLMTQAVTEQDKTIYVYISVSMQDSTQEAVFAGEFVWSLIRAEESTLATAYLNSGDGEGGQDSVTFIKGDVAMPLIYDIPSYPDETMGFEGYYTGLNGSGIKYINADGTSAHVADLADGATLYANYSDEIYLMNGTMVIGLTDVGKNISTLSLPSDTTEIGDSAFANNAVVTSVVIPDTVTTIGTSAFENDSNLETVTFGEAETLSYADSTSTLEAIGSYAFSGCTSLSTFDMPDSVKTINTYAFKNCTSLTNLTFGENSQINTIEVGAYTTSGLTEVTFNNNPHWVNIRGIFPTTLTKTNAASVETYMNLGYYSWQSSPAFRSHNLYINGELLVDLVIPSGMTSFQGSLAFSDIWTIETVYIPNSITTMENHVFYNCQGLKTVTFEEGSNLTTIKQQAFNECKSLTEITIPSTVNLIEKFAFSGCSSLTSVAFEDASGWFVADSADATEGTDITISETDFAANATLVKTTYASKYFLKTDFFTYSEDGLTITGLTTVGEAASELVVPNTVTAIGQSAFYQWGGVSVTIPESVTSIGDEAFSDCGSLISVIFAENSQLTSIGDSAFYYCSSLTSITIPSSVTIIGKQAFRECLVMSRINLESLGSWLSLTFVDEYGSYYSHPFFSSAAPSHEYYLNGVPLTEVDIPSGVTTIPGHAFYWGENITSVTIPEGVTSIGYEAFAKCSGLTSVTIPSGVISLGRYVFFDCTSMSQINIENLDAWLSLTFVDEYGASKDSHPFCSSTASSREYYLNGNAMTEVEISSNVTQIPAYAFYYGENITTVTIPSGVTSIGENAFYSCSALTTVNMSNSVTSMGINAFYSCGLTDIYFEGSEEEWNAISGLSDAAIPDTCTIHFAILAASPASYFNFSEDGTTVTGLTDAAKAMTDLDLVVGGGNITTLGTGAFANLTNIRSITFLDTVTTLDAGALNCCVFDSLYISKSISSISTFTFSCNELSSIIVDSENPTFNSGGENGNCIIVTNTNTLIRGCKTTTIPSTVTALGDDNYMPFDGELIESITIPNSVETIGSGCFSLCKTLSSITFEEGSALTTLGSGAVNGCSALESIVLPSSVTSIGNAVFGGCSSLTSITIPSSVTSIGIDAFSGCSSLTSVAFEDVSGWFVADSADATSGTTVTLSTTDLKVNAELLKTTHCSKYWKRSA